MIPDPKASIKATVRGAAAAALVGLAACSVPAEPTEINDPFEDANRSNHALNKNIDRAVLRPASRAYGETVPEPVRRSLANAATNLRAPTNIVNDVLQGQGEDAIHNTFRFLINTTVGVLGLFDPATSFGLEERRTGFADTLAVWGAPEGAYLELPVLGPSTQRDSLGRMVDILTNPVTAIVGEDALAVSVGTAVPAMLNSRFEFGATLDSILYDSADSYTQLRLYYLENRRFQLGKGTASGTGTDTNEDLYNEVYEGLYD